MKKFFNITNRKLTDYQKADAVARFAITDFVELPADLKKRWANIPPTIEGREMVAYLQPIADFVKAETNSRPYTPSDNDVVLLDGDLGACIDMAYCGELLFNDWLIVQSTTERISQDVPQPDGSVKKTSIARHVIFRSIGV